MQLDVFTLIPHAFAWLTEQRPVAAVLGDELDLRLFSYRDYTPLAGGQVDDEPYGGGAGMVLRVDVVAADRQLRAPGHPVLEPDHRAPARALRRGDAHRLAVDIDDCAAGESLGILARALDEERSVEPVRPAHPADRHEIGHLSRRSRP